MTSTAIYINGYGAPKEPLKDENLLRYLQGVLDYIKSHPYDKFSIYLFGGITNNPDLSEAEAMHIWFKSRRLPSNILNFTLTKDTRTAAENLIAFSQMVNTSTHTIFFCEYSRRFHVHFLIGRLFENFELHGIKFDRKSLRFINFLIQIFFRLPLAILAWYLPFIDKWIQKPLRTLHVYRCRKKLRNQ